MLSGVERSSIIKIVAIYFVIAAILGLCGGLALFGLGGMAGIMGGSASLIGNANLPPDAQQALSEAGNISIFAMLLGIVSIILAPIMLVVAYGLFQRKAWARQGTILVAAISVIESLLSLSSGFTSIITLIISAFVLYLFWTDEGIKMELSQ